MFHIHLLFVLIPCLSSSLSLSLHSLSSHCLASHLYQIHTHNNISLSILDAHYSNNNDTEKKRFYFLPPFFRIGPVCVCVGSALSQFNYINLFCPNRNRLKEPFSTHSFFFVFCLSCETIETKVKIRRFPIDSNIW